MSIREYIRSFLLDDLGDKIITHSFNESGSAYDMLYSPKKIKKECENLCGDLLTEDMQLAYFSLDYKGEVNGAAWTEIKEGKKYNFVILTTEDAPDHVYTELIHDCMDEFSFLKSEMKEDLELAIEVFDEETKDVLSECFNLSIIKNKSGFYIMGDKR